jgi:ornithine carbamoyltransferase
MSSAGHPCEVLTDAYFIHTSLKEITSARVCLWGPTTNIFRSWHELARVFDIEITQVCEEQLHEVNPNVRFMASAPRLADIVITDARRSQPVPCALPLTQEHLIAMGLPTLLPTPPFSIGRELLFDPVSYAKFAGYLQKALLVPVQKAIIRHAMGA